MRIGMFVLGFAIFAMACAQTKTAPGPRYPGTGKKGGYDDGRPGAYVTYEDDIKDLIDKYKCATCHEKEKDGPDLSDYASVKKASKKVLASVKDGTMPKGAKAKKLSASEIKMIEEWIDGGHLERAIPDEDEGKQSTADLISYDGWVKGFLKDNCISCHGSGSKDGDFSTYAKAKASAKRIYETSGTTMPLGNVSKVSSAQKSKLKAWIDQGTPEKDDEIPLEDDAGSGGDDTPSVSYDNGIKEWVDRYCISCHRTGQAPILASKSQVQAAANQILDSVKKGRMPVGNRLSASQYKIVEDWIDAGKK